jgi:hypothetical protein
MSNELATTGGFSFGSLSGGADAMNAAVRGLPKQTFVSPIRILQGLSKELTDRESYPDARAGSYFWNGRVLPSRVNMVVLAVRVRGVRYENGKAVENVYDPNDARFLEWFDAKGRKDVCAGPEYLLWLPEFEGFARLHLYRSAVNNMDDFQRPGRPLCMWAKKIEHRGNTWYVSRANLLSDVNPDSEWSKPDPDHCERVIKDFNNPSGGEDIKDVAATVKDESKPKPKSR